MMKRYIVAILIVLVSITQIGAVVSLDQRSLTITGYKDQYVEFLITPIYNPMNAGSGMPFDLSRDDVAYVDGLIGQDESGSPVVDHTAGRAIAMWSVHSNQTPLKFTIKAEPLKLVYSYDPDSGKSTEGMDYYLFFPYIYNSVNTDGTATNGETGFMMVSSEDAAKGGYVSTSDPLHDGGPNPISKELISGEVSGIGLSTNEYPVRFMLNETPAELSDFEPGVYNANVTITVECMNL